MWAGVGDTFPDSMLFLLCCFDCMKTSDEPNQISSQYTIYCISTVTQCVPHTCVRHKDLLLLCLVVLSITHTHTHTHTHSHIHTDFGNRPRRLYVIVNPASGGGKGASEKVWHKVQQMFTVGQVVTDVTSESLHTSTRSNDCVLVTLEPVCVCVCVCVSVCV